MITMIKVKCATCHNKIEILKSWSKHLEKLGKVDSMRCLYCREDELASKRFAIRYPEEKWFTANCGSRIKPTREATGNPCWHCGVYRTKWYERCLNYADMGDWRGWEVVNGNRPEHVPILGSRTQPERDELLQEILLEPTILLDDGLNSEGSNGDEVEYKNSSRSRGPYRRHTDTTG